jgi:glycosyltransferase involved in cell wall biosynthesis
MEVHPDATLILTYGAEIPPTPGVINLGSVDGETMNEIYRTSEFWVYPCSGTELYCMTGIKAQAAGCVPVVIPHMALAETVRVGYKPSPEAFTAALIIALNADNTDITDALAKEHYPTWNDSTNQLEELIKMTYNKNITP